jgi:hypothetical protein
MRVFRRLFLISVVTVGPLCAELFAQGGPPVGGPPPCIPIDGGLGLLIGAGALLGGKKALDLRRERQDVNP